MGLKELMAADAANKIMDDTEYAEVIAYTPAGGALKYIRAIVDRKPIAPAGEDSGRTLVGTVEISILRDDTNGILTITKGRDKVAMPEVLGGVDVNYVVTDIVDHDTAIWVLSLRK